MDYPNLDNGRLGFDAEPPYMVQASKRERKKEKKKGSAIIVTVRLLT